MPILLFIFAENLCFIYFIGIMEKVNFKNVVRAIRFDLLGSIQTPTPCEFESLSDAEKLSLDRFLFDVFHDTCTLLSFALDTEKLLSKYDVDFKD